MNNANACHGKKYSRYKGANQLELLVAIGIIMAMFAILMPVLIKARQDSDAVRTMNNLHQIIIAVNCFASNHDGSYPESTATIGSDGNWNWQEPKMMTSSRSRGLNLNRSMSAYLKNYIEDPAILFCPNAPRKYKYLRQMWQAADTWDNPDTPSPQDPVMGTYCFYWNYTGFIEGRTQPFKGPRGMSLGMGQSSLLVSDYFGYGHWRSPNAFGSCERFDGAAVTEGTSVSSAYWSSAALDAKKEQRPDKIKLNAGFTDGHVESYSSSNLIPMKVSITSDGKTPYPDNMGPGIFYLPAAALP